MIPMKVQQKKATPQKGWIYCLSNPSFPDKVKIGFTTQSVEERMEQLDGTSTPTAFKLAGKWKSRDVEKDEKFLHRKLAKYRTRSNREFFDLTAKDAVPKVTSLLGKTPRLSNQPLTGYARNGLAQGFATILAVVAVIFILVSL